MPNITIPAIATTQSLPYSTDFMEVGRTGQSNKTPMTLLALKAPTTAAMTALSVMGIADKALLLISNGTAVNDFTGIFVYNAASVLAANGTTIFAPDSGSGRWLSVLGATGAYDPAGSAAAAQAAAIAASLQKSANLSDVASKITSKNNLNFRMINVRDYGAVGNGSADDTAACQAAASAVTSNSMLYFPAGTYKITSAFGFASTTLQNVTICGDGMSSRILNDSGSSGGNTCVIPYGCSRFEIYGLYWDGTSTVRGSGIHIRCGAGQSRIHHNYFTGCSDFAVHISGETSGYISNCLVSDNFFGASLGDGVHVGTATDCLVADNVFFGTGDDSMAAVADYPSFPPTRVQFVGNKVVNAGAAGSSGCGLRICEGVDILAIGNQIITSVEAGIRVTRNGTTTPYSYNITLIGNTVRDTGSNGGQRGGIWVEWVKGCMIQGNNVGQLISGNGICYLDCEDLVIDSNNVLNQTVRAIASDDSTTTNVATTWNRIFITKNIINLCTNEAIYNNPASGITVADLMITGNSVERAANGGGSDYIFTNRLSGLCKIGNNTTLQTKGIAFGGSGTVPTTFNNN